MIFTRESLAQEIQITYKKAISSFGELVAANLIWEKRVGRGNANQIYPALVELPASDAAKHTAAPFGNEGARPAQTAHLAGERPATRPVETARQDLPLQQVKTSQNGTYAPTEMAHPDLPKLHSSKKEKNYNDMSDIDKISPSASVQEDDTDSRTADIMAEVCGNSLPEFLRVEPPCLLSFYLQDTRGYIDLPAEFPVSAQEIDQVADGATTTEHEDTVADLAVLFAEMVQEDSDPSISAMPESHVSVSVSDASEVTAEAEASQAKTTKSKIVKGKTDKAVNPAENDIPPPKNTHPSFYSLDFRTLDRDLSPEQEQEWNAIYASFRSRSILTGTVIGVDDHTFDVTDERGAVQRKTIRSLIIVSFQVKVMIPETEVWAVGEESPYYTLRGMVGAKVDYVVMNVDRENDCVIASRRIAMTKRRHMLQTARNNRELVDCDTILVSRKAMLVNCGGFDLVLTQKGLSYTAIDDLRTMYKPGAQLTARLMDMIGNKPVISVKEVNPNPFDGADQRHPVGCRRQGIIEGKYTGGVFCRLPDNTTCLCLYSNNHYDREFDSGDAVLVHITEFDYRRKLIHGHIVGKQ